MSQVELMTLGFRRILAGPASDELFEGTGAEEYRVLVADEERDALLEREGLSHLDPRRDIDYIQQAADCFSDAELTAAAVRTGLLTADHAAELLARAA